MIRLIQRRFGEAESLLREVLEVNRGVRDLPAEGSVQLHLGLVYQEQGDLDRAEAAFRAAVDVTRRIGDLRFHAGALRYLGQLEWERGRAAAALPLLEEAMDVCRRMGDEANGQWAKVHAAALAAQAGRIDEARRMMDECAASFAGFEDVQGVAVASIHRGHLELAESERAREAGDGDEATRRATRAQAILDWAPDIESDEVRFALRVLRSAIDRNGRERA
jgi:tetratricopeptide (TPR) repeat protein